MAPAPAGAAIQEVIDAVAGEVRASIRERSDELGVSVRFIVRAGDPLEELKRTAVRMQADMVVVGSSESTGHRLVGSLANRMVRTGKWPVTVVP